MKITIITPTYNSAKTLSRTIDSVISQNYNNLEYIIIDGVSTDGTQKIIEAYGDKINIKIISEPDNGIYDAMNKGVKLATGEIIGILNSDDFYHSSNVLDTVSKAFESSDVDAIYGDLKYFDNDINKITRYWKTGEYNESKLNNGWIIPHPTLFVKKYVYDNCGLFNTNFKISADYEFILRILKISKIEIKYIPETFVRMYEGGTSGRNLKQRKNGWKELKMAWTVNGLKTPCFYNIRRVTFKLKQLVFKK